MDASSRRTALAMWAAAHEKLGAARLLLSENHCGDSLSRSYYAAFHGVSLLFFLYGKSFSRHSALIGAFNKDFVFSGIFPQDVGKALSALFAARQAGDYDVFQSSDRDEAIRGIREAESILLAIAEHCLNKFALNLPEMTH